MEMLQGVWKQHLRPRAVVGYGVKIFLPSPPNYVTRSPGEQHEKDLTRWYFRNQNENLKSWLCVERVLDENDRGKLEITSCFPS